MENLEKKLLEKVLNLVVGEFCDSIWFSAEYKHIEVYNHENNLAAKLQFNTEEETLFAVNMFLQTGFQVRADCVRKYKIVEDKTIVPLCKED